MKKLIVILLLLLCAAPVWAWRDKRDNKSIAELELMNQNDLAFEAYYPCGEVTLYNKFKVVSSADALEHSTQMLDAANYLRAIGLVARKKNGGTDTLWLRSMLDAEEGTDMNACLAAAMSAPLPSQEERQRGGKSAQQKNRKKTE
jgi:hypothetical protein